MEESLAASGKRNIRAARVVAQKPETMEMLRKREVSLCTLSLIQGKVKDAPELIEQIKGKSKREVESLQELMPVKASLRETITPVKVITPPPVSLVETGQRNSLTSISTSPPMSPKASATGEPPRFEAKVEERLKLAFTVSSESQMMINQAKTLLSSKFPTGATLEELFYEGLSLIIQSKSEKRAKLGSRKSKRSTSESRYIPSKIKKTVLERDGYKCCSCPLKPWRKGNRHQDIAYLR